MGRTALLFLRRKACWGFFRSKNPTASAGCEPTNLGTKGQHPTSRPPKPLRQVSFIDSRQIYTEDQSDSDKKRPDKWNSTVLIAFPLQEWLDERATILRHTLYVHCTVSMIHVRVLNVLVLFLFLNQSTVDGFARAKPECNVSGWNAVWLVLSVLTLPHLVWWFFVRSFSVFCSFLCVRILVLVCYL
jgi:hypothetical protein